MAGTAFYLVSLDGFLFTLQRQGRISRSTINEAPRQSLITWSSSVISTHTLRYVNTSLSSKARLSDITYRSTTDQKCVPRSGASLGVLDYGPPPRPNTQRT